MNYKLTVNLLDFVGDNRIKADISIHGNGIYGYFTLTAPYKERGTTKNSQVSPFWDLCTIANKLNLPIGRLLDEMYAEVWSALHTVDELFGNERLA